MTSANNKSQLPVQHRAKPSGGCVLLMAIFGLFLAWLSHQVAHVRVAGGFELLVDAGYWAIGMAAVLGAAMVSIRRNKDEEQLMACIAAVICVISIGCVMVELVVALLG
jgi:hypothetical protein